MAVNARVTPHLPEETSLPSEMLEAPRWVCWRYLKRDGKLTKVPINPSTGEFASSTDPETWARFRQACLRAQTDDLAGIGFMLGDGFVGIDLDHCRNAETGELEPWGQQIVDEMSSYTEVSPRREGCHIIAYGVIPGIPTPEGKQGSRKQYGTGEVEMYAGARFFTVTGQQLVGAVTTLERRDHELAALWRRIFAEKETPRPERRAATGALPDDEALIAEMKAAANGAKFARLWDGDTSDYGGDESRADAALIQMLAFWTQDDPTTIDRLFRRSGLMRDKWDSRRGASTYGAQTIERTLGRSHETRRPRVLHEELSQREESAEVILSANGLHATDMGNAERLVARHHDNLRYVTKRDKWFVWDGRVWAEDYSDHALTFAKETARAIYQEAADAQDDVMRKELAKHAIRSASEHSLRAMLSLSRHDLRIAPDELDRDPWALNVENGVIDLRTGDLRPHNRRDYLTKLAPVTFDVSATAPTFDAFLHRIMAGNERLIAFLQRAIGYSLTADTTEQVFFLAIGMGANGKSTLLSVFERMLGGYATHSRPETFMVKKGEQVPQDVARLNGARFVSTVETEDGQRLAESLIKSLTGSDPMTARFMRENEFSFTPVLKLWMATNHEPKIRGTDHAIWRRVLRIPFAVQIPESEKDKRLEAKLYAERAGILNWALQGCLAWQRDGLKPPQEVTQATAEYQSRMDVLGQFVEEICVEGPEHRVPLNHAYQKYKAWCEENNEYAVKKLEFSQRMTDRSGVMKRPGTGNVTTLFGLGIRAPQVEEAS